MQNCRSNSVTTKAAATRERLFQAAIDSFAERGYTATTMRQIASDAHCALGLTYRYFGGKDEVVFELYERLADEIVARSETLPRGTVAQRFTALMHIKFEVLGPYHQALGGLVGTAVTPGSRTSPMSSRAGHINRKLSVIFLKLVREASDAPRSALQGELAQLLQIAHLGVILLWLHDDSPGKEQSAMVVDQISGALRLLRRALLIPGMGSRILGIASSLAAMVPGLDSMKPE